MLALIAMSVIQFLGLKGNKVFDAVNSAEADTAALPTNTGAEAKSPLAGLNINTDGIRNMAQNAAGGIAGAAESLKDKASQAAQNIQNRAPAAKKEDPQAVMEQIKQLHDMKENGILTEEEFAEKKKEFLARL